MFVTTLIISVAGFGYSKTERFEDLLATPEEDSELDCALDSVADRPNAKTTAAAIVKNFVFIILGLRVN
jgi:hypothetical protein